MSKKNRQFKSHQEAAIEEFLQQSFGANSLFVPEEYRKGNATREPADLAWAMDDFVALFYMKSGSSGLEKQMAGNKKQFHGYLRQWKSQESLYVLRGRNRFKDEFAIKYSDVKLLVGILVTSAECGCSVAKLDLPDKMGIEITIPDKLLHVVASFRGTIVDLLKIIHISHHHLNTLEPRDAFPKLLEAAHQYVNTSITLIRDKGSAFSPENIRSTEQLYQDLAMMRMPGNFGKALKNHEGRRITARIFGDMSIHDYGVLLQGVHKALENSGPNFEKYCIVAVNSYYKFVISTVNLQSSNCLEVSKKALELGVDSDGVNRSVLIQYHKIGDLNDPRKPSLFGFASQQKEKQSSELLQKIMSEIA